MTTLHRAVIAAAFTATMFLGGGLGAAEKPSVGAPITPAPTSTVSTIEAATTIQSGSSNGGAGQNMADGYEGVPPVKPYCYNHQPKFCCKCSDDELTKLINGCTPDSSRIDNVALNLVHDATDYQTPTSGGGCTPCGGGNVGPGLRGLTLGRIHSFRDVTERASFAPGVFSSYDQALRISTIDAATNQPTALRFFDHEMPWGNTLTLMPGSVGVFVETGYTSFRDVTLYSSYSLTTGTGTPVVAGYKLAGVSHAVLTRNDGSTLVFEIGDVEKRQGLDPDLRNPVAALPAGTVQGFGLSMLNYGAYKTARFDSFEVRNASDAVLYREIFPSNGVQNPAGLNAEGWSFLSDGVTGPSGFVQGDVSEALTAVNSNPVATNPGYAAYLQGIQGNMALISSEYTSLSVSDIAKIRFTTKHQQATGLANRVMVKVGGTWYVSGTGPTHTASGWQQQDVALAGITTWYPATLQSSKHEYRARLVKIADRNNYGTTLGYAAIQPNAYNDTFNEFATLTDARGATATVTWAAAQVGGQYVISSIALPNGSALGYQYAGGFLSGVTYPDGTQTAITRSIQGSLTVIDIKDAGADTTHRNKIAYFSNQVGYGLPGPMSAARIMKLKNGAGEWSYWNLNVGTDPNGFSPMTMVYEGGNYIKIVQDSGVKMVKNFTFTPTSTGAMLSLSQITWTLENTTESKTFSDWQRSQVSTVTNDSGVRYDFTWTPTGKHLTMKRAGDNALETTTYNSFDQPLLNTDALGRKTLHTYDARGNCLSITEAQGTADEATTTSVYYPAGHPNQFLIQEERSAKYSAATPDLFNTRFVYDANQRLIQRIAAADVTGGPRPVQSFAWDAAGRLVSSTDPEGRTVAYAYDNRNRVTTMTYADTSTETMTYYTTESGGIFANLVKSTKDRNGNVETCTYDAVGRKTFCTISSPSSVVVQTKSMAYLIGTTQVETATVDGDTVTYEFDNRNRVINAITTPNTGTALIASTTYLDTRPAFSTDAYGRRSFSAYDVPTGRMLRAVRELIVGGISGTPTNAQLLALPRDTNLNPAYVISETQYDLADQTTASIDARGIRSTYEYDQRGRTVAQVAADAVISAANVVTLQFSPVAARTTTVYDLDSNVTEQTAPRHWTRNGDGTWSPSANGPFKSSMAYNGRNLTSSMTEAAGTAIAATSTTTYTPTGKTKTQTDALSRTTTYQYGVCCDRLVKVTDPAGFENSFTYDFYGNRVTATDGNGLTTTSAYDARHRPVSMTNAAGETLTYVYDENLTDGSGLDTDPRVSAVLPLLSLGAGADGSAVKVTNPNGEASFSLRDGAGRTIAQIDALGHASRMVYDQVTSGLLVTQGIDTLNHASESHSDAAGLTRKSVDALGKISTASFDANGNRISYRDADGVGLDCVMDARNRDTTCTDTGSPAATTSKTFDSDGNVITATDALGKVMTVAYDARGRKTTTTDRINAVTAFTYDAVSNLLTIIDAQGGLTSYQYNNRNLLTREEFPTHVAGTNPGQVGNDAKTYTYDAGRRLTSRTDQAGVVTSYAYDNANRLITRGYPDSLNDTFSYDPASRLVSAASARYTNTVARSYDAAGRLLSEGLTTNGQIYSTLSGYDNANRRTTITYPNGQVISRAYSDRNQLSDIWYGAQTPSNRALTRTYTDAGRLFISNFGNNRTELRSYLTDGLTNAMVTPGVTNFTYGYDANKRKTQETNGITPNNSQTFSYDFQDRLTNWTRLSGDAQNWSLSLVGDWNSTTGSKNGSAFSETRTHNAVHELTAINSAPLGYDFKGNLTQDQTSKLYAWDQENRLKQAVIPAGLTDGSTAGTHTYQYDALGRRVAKVVAGTVTVFAHDGAQVICEYTGTLAPTSPARIQVWGDYIDELILHINSGQKYYAHVNHLYSVEALTDSAGTVVERYQYDAYGSQKVYSRAGVARAASLFGQKTGLTGRYSDSESQLWYFRNRYHDSVIGRFVSRDPLGYADGMSLYSAYFIPEYLDETGMGLNKPSEYKPAKDPSFLGKSLKGVVDWIIGEVVNRGNGPFDFDGTVPFVEVTMGIGSIAAAGSASGMKCKCCKSDGSDGAFIEGIFGVGARVSIGKFYGVPVIKKELTLPTGPVKKCPSEKQRCPDSDITPNGTATVTIGADYGLIIAAHHRYYWDFKLPDVITGSTKVVQRSSFKIDIGIQGGAAVWAQLDANADFAITIP